MEQLLELMRVQRHNFANHLQVISGLLQLKKYDRAFEYIKGVGEELNRAGTVAKVEICSLVHTILIAELAAGKKGIHFEYHVEDDLSGFKGSVDVLVTTVQKMLEGATRFLESNPWVENVIKVGIREKDGKIYVELGLAADTVKRNGSIASYYDGIEEKVRAQGWTFSVQEENQVLITLII